MRTKALDQTFTDTQKITGFLGDTIRTHVATNFKVSVVTYTKKVTEDWHHHDYSHLSWILNGGNLETRRSNEIQVKPGTILLYDVGEIHRNRFTAHPSKNLNIEFGPDFFNDEISLTHYSNKAENTTDLLKIYMELSYADSYSADAIEHMVKSLFWNSEKTLSKDWVEKAKEIINDQWSEFLSLDYLSKELHMHPVTISKHFSKRTGFTLAEYMRKVKICRAIDMLISTQKPYAEIAAQCGFSDQSHMTRLIREFTGTTPGKIRAFI